MMHLSVVSSMEHFKAVCCTEYKPLAVIITFLVVERGRMEPMVYPMEQWSLKGNVLVRVQDASATQLSHA